MSMGFELPILFALSGRGTYLSSFYAEEMGGTTAAVAVAFGTEKKELNDGLSSLLV